MQKLTIDNMKATFEAFFKGAEKTIIRYNKNDFNE